MKIYVIFISFHIAKRKHGKMEKDEDTLISEITDEHKALIIEILKIVKNSGLRIEYAELSQKILDNYGININPHLGMHHALGKISEISYKLNLPMLSVIVISKAEQRPSQGFFELYDELHNTHIKGNKYFEEKIYKQEREAVKECKDWSKLLKKLDINDIDE